MDADSIACQAAEIEALQAQYFVDSIWFDWFDLQISAVTICASWTSFAFDQAIYEQEFELVEEAQEGLRSCKFRSFIW